MKTVLIYKTELLPVSETFILAQASALRLFRPLFAGLKPAAKSLGLPKDALLATSDTRTISRIKVHLYRVFGIAPEFLRKVRSAQPSLIHSHFATESVTALPIARLLQIPLIVTLHGADVTVRDAIIARTLGGRLYLQRRAELWRRTSVFLCVSEFILLKAIEAGFPKGKLRVHYIGIDQSRFVTQSISVSKDTILFVGRLTEKKGCKYLLEAMKLVQQECPDAQLTVIGEGRLRAALEARARELKLTCIFLGAQSSEIVRGYMASAKVFCVPSVRAGDGDSEGLGMVFAEAQAMGLPVVSFNHGGIPEVVVQGQTGLLAPEGDQAALARDILIYLKDEQLRKETAQRGRAWIAKRFDIVTQTAELETIYSEVIADFKSYG